MKICTRHEVIIENIKVCVRDPVCRAIRERTNGSARVKKSTQATTTKFDEDCELKNPAKYD